jgi:hypothetical protein
MKRLTLCMTLLVGSWNCANGATPFTEQEQAEGYVSVFDGQTLDEWQIEKGGRGEIRGGVIVFRPNGADGRLLTDFEYENFTLKTEWRFTIEGKGGGGLLFGVPRDGRKSDRAYLVEMRAGSEGKVDGLTGAKAVPALMKPQGEWNTLELTAEGPKVTLIVNGKNAWEATGRSGDRMRGAIGWQAMNAPLEIRKFIVKELGFKPLFNGRDLTGWHPSDAKNWVADDRMLVNKRTGADLMSDAKFRDFEFRYSYKIPKGSNSGVYLRGCYELQIDDAYGQPISDKRNGAIYSEKAPDKNVTRPVDHWNTVTVIMRGRTVNIWMNGERIHKDYAITGITPGALDDKENEPGPIYLQGSHGPVAFRDLRIRELDKTP